MTDVCIWIRKWIFRVNYSCLPFLPATLPITPSLHFLLSDLKGEREFRETVHSNYLSTSMFYSKEVLGSGDIKNIQKTFWWINFKTGIPIGGYCVSKWPTVFFLWSPSDVMSNNQFHVEKLLFFFVYISLFTTTRLLSACATRLETFIVWSALLPWFWSFVKSPMNIFYLIIYCKFILSHSSTLYFKLWHKLNLIFYSYNLFNIYDIVYFTRTVLCFTWKVFFYM